jgi:hypothetical protein
MSDQHGVVSIDDLAARLERTRAGARHPGGYSGLEFDDLVTTLALTTKPPEGASANEWQRQCEGAAFDLAKKQAAITGPRLKAALGQRRKKFNLLPLQTYVLATSFASRHAVPWNNTTVNGHTLTYSARLPSRFDRSNVMSCREPRLINDDRGFVQVRACVKGKTLSAAHSAAMRTLDLVRGAMNFSLNRGLHSAIANESAPVNRVLCGPVQTLHHQDGTLACDAFWYDPFFRAPHPLPTINQAWKRAASVFLDIRALIKRSAFGEEIEEAIVRYCRALDSPDPNSAFLKLWGVLEFVTGTGRLPYAHTVRRCSFLYGDPLLERPILENLCEARNRSVHAGSDNLERKNVVRLHRFVADTLTFILQGSRFFTSLSEAGQFMSLSPDHEHLKRLLKLHREAVKFKG